MNRVGSNALAALLLVSCLASCEEEGRPASECGGDETLFATQVQPILRGLHYPLTGRQTGCAFLGCHGREGMPLTLYAVDYLRLRDPDGAFVYGQNGERVPELDERALTPQELEHNRCALAARVTEDDPQGERLIRRLIPSSRGGIPHADVVVYERTNDPELETLRRYLRTVRAP